MTITNINPYDLGFMIGAVMIGYSFYGMLGAGVTLTLVSSTFAYSQYND